MNISSFLAPGHNVLAMEAENLPASVAANPAGLIASIHIETSDGKDISIPSDSTWLSTQDVKAADWATLNFDDHAWSPAKVIGPYGCAPWGQFATAHPTYGPFAAGIPGKVRVIYVPAPAMLRINHLQAGATYHAQVFDPSTGQTTSLGDVHPDAQASWSLRFRWPIRTLPTRSSSSDAPTESWTCAARFPPSIGLVDMLNGIATDGAPINIAEHFNAESGTEQGPFAKGVSAAHGGIIGVRIVELAERKRDFERRKSRLRGLNSRPMLYESIALPLS